MVFLVLAAQFESWSMPLAVILSVPLCLLSAMIGVNIAKHGHQHLHPDRPGGAGGPGQQERDPDRRVRQGDPPLGQADPGGDARGVPAAAAADHHDLDGVHPGRAAALARPRRRRRDAAVAGHGRLQRHARRDALRHLPDARLLLSDRLAERGAHLRTRRCVRWISTLAAGDPHAPLPVAAARAGACSRPAKPAAARRERAPIRAANPSPEPELEPEPVEPK